MKRIITSLILLLLLIFAAQIGMATEEIAIATGQDCADCHLDPSGGGELTAAGAAYLIDATAAGEIETLSTGSKFFRLLVGYLHIVFAVLWFGTILYVHIVLKPAYAEKGLPRGEKFVGILSFWVVGITGVILANYRIGTFETLWNTRFGVLLTIKATLYLTMLISAVLVIKIIGPRLARREPVKHIAGQPFNEKTLKGFNGQDGRPCYFAYQGKVYDASSSKMWPGGEHMRRHSSGRDLTDDLPMAPHDESVMPRLPVVGEYVTEGAEGKKPATTAFYIIAYMNLTIVFLILFIIALWRWG
ncbi:MAG TPA: cytochrome b5 domain-containing protein [Geopsychrobacteraceae bacterium]|nr:cytochrome b5 domain-containing protein [Geopsychrobacteraceae bacterium]